MRIFIKRITGILLMTTAIVGMLFCLAGLGTIWRFKPSVKADLLNNLKLVGSALDTTSEALTIADQTVTTAVDSMTAFQNTIAATQSMLDAAAPTLDTLVGLMDVDLPGAVSAAQSSLASAQKSAKIIDSVLRAITALPFISKDIYNPPVPLHVALGQISASLDALPNAFKTVRKSLETSREKLNQIHVNFDQMGKDIQEIRSALTDAQSLVDDYQSLVGEFQSRVNQAIKVLPRWMNILVWLATFLLVWAAIVQLGLFVQGLGLCQKKGSLPIREPETKNSPGQTGEES